MISFLFFLWIAYTVGSLSVIFAVVSLSIIARWDNKRNDARIRELLKARPEDSE